MGRKDAQAHEVSHGGKIVNKGIKGIKGMEAMKSMKITESVKFAKSVKQHIESQRSDLHPHKFQDQQAWGMHHAAEGGCTTSRGAAAYSDRQDCLRGD